MVRQLCTENKEQKNANFLFTWSNVCDLCIKAYAHGENSNCIMNMNAARDDCTSAWYTHCCFEFAWVVVESTDERKHIHAFVCLRDNEQNRSVVFETTSVMVWLSLSTHRVLSLANVLLSIYRRNVHKTLTAYGCRQFTFSLISCLFYCSRTIIIFVQNKSKK